MLSNGRLRIVGVAAAAAALFGVVLYFRSTSPSPVGSGLTSPVASNPGGFVFDSTSSPGAVAVPAMHREAPGGFVAVEPGFFVRKDSIPRVERARAYLRELQAKVALLTGELMRIAAKHRLDLSRDNPFGDLYSALNSGSTFTNEEAIRVAQLLEAWDGLKRVAPEGLPLRAFAPPSSVLEMLETLRRPANPFEFAFYKAALVSELQLCADEVFDVPDRPNEIVVKLDYHPLLLSTLESWLVPGGSAPLALELLARNLVATVPEYAAAASRIGREALELLGPGTAADARTAALGFLRAHLATQTRELLFSELRAPDSDARIPFLCQVLPTTLSEAETTALRVQLLSRPTPAARSALAVALIRTLGPLLQRRGVDPAVDPLLESLDAAFFASGDSLAPIDVGSYAITRLGSADPERRAELLGHLDSALSHAGPSDRRILASRIGQIRSEAGVKALGRLAVDADDAVAELGIVQLVDFVVNSRVAGSDDALASALTSISETRARLAVTALAAHSAAPRRLQRTISALEILSAGARSQELRSLAAAELARLRK